MDVWNAAENGREHPVLDQPRHKQVQALECVEANRLIGAEPFRGQHDDRSDPADTRDIAQDGCRARRDRVERIARRRRHDRLPGAAPRAINIRGVHLISALAAKRHPYFDTLRQNETFRQRRSTACNVQLLAAARGHAHHLAWKDTDAICFSHSIWSLPESPPALESMIWNFSTGAAGLLISIFTRPRSAVSSYASPHSPVFLLTMSVHWSGTDTSTNSV